LRAVSARRGESARSLTMRPWSYYTPILTYHRVGTFQYDHVPTVSGRVFERQLTLLTRWRYRVLSLTELVERLEQGQMPRRSAVITFDDGYAETYDVAWPLLKRAGFPSTVFVAPGEVGRPGFVSWDQLTEMAHDGTVIGSHTMHHSYLPHVKDDRLNEELIASKQVIESRIGRAINFISYPIGGFTAQAQEVVKRAGYRAACTTNRRAFETGIDRFALRRIKMTERDGAALLFYAKLSGYYNMFRRLKSPG